MKKIKLSENLELSQVVMGCMRIADSNLTENELLDLVEKCLDMGVTSIDHAPVYGGYTCEKIFGDAVTSGTEGQDAAYHKSWYRMPGTLWKQDHLL